MRSASSTAERSVPARADPHRPRRLTAAGLGLLAGLLAGLITWAIPTLELASLDLRFRLRGPRPLSNQVVLVTLNDRGLASVGHWSTYARVISGLKALGAKVVTTDIVFRLAGEDSQSLVQATRLEGATVHPLAVDFTPEGVWIEDGAVTTDGGPIPAPLLGLRYKTPIERGELLAVDRLMAPHHQVVAASSALGSIGFVADPDGAFRRFPILVDLDGQALPSAPLETVRLALGISPEAVSWTGQALRLRLEGGGERTVPTDARGQVLLNYPGRWSDPNFDWIDPALVLKWLDDPASAPDLLGQLDGKICLLGVTGTGTTDLTTTPYEQSAPRLLGLASLIDQILADRPLRQTAGWMVWLICLALGAMVAFQASRKRVTALIIAAACGLTLWPLAAQLIFSIRGAVVPVAGPMLSLLLATGLGVALRLTAAERARRQVVDAFGRYLSPAVLDKVLEQRLMPAAERKQLTILFSDIVSFSSYCDKVEPEVVHRLLNEYLEQMVDCVFIQEGTVDKFIGDGVLAFFGDPLDQVDHAQRAVRAGMDMLKRVEELNGRWRAEGRHEIAIRIGINTGPTVVGNVGASKRLEYTVLGDAVNRAQRLEAASRPGCLLIGRQTFKLVERDFPAATGVGQVPGKRDERMQAWELAGPKPGEGGKRLT